MITGAGELASAGAGTTHGYGMAGAGEVTAGAGAGTILGDGTDGAGEATAGAGATHIGAMAGVDIMATLGTDLITIEDTATMVIPIIEVEEVIQIPSFLALPFVEDLI